MAIDLEALEEILEPIVRGSNLQHTLERLRELRAGGGLTPAAEVAVDLAEAHCLDDLHQTGESAAVIEQVSERLASEPEEFDDELERLRAGLISARGFNALIGEDAKLAIRLLEEAAERYGALEFPYRQSGALINLSIALLRESKFRRGLAMLDRAAELTQGLTEGQRVDREVAIAINRASVYGILGEGQRAVDVMQAARPLVIEGGDPRMLANLDLNLGSFYDRLERFGSALEAARSAACEYRRAGLEVEARGAEAAVGKALGRLGRTGEAESTLKRLLRLGEEEEGRAPWLEPTVDALVSVFRTSGRGPDGDALEARFASLRAWSREAQLANEMLKEVNRLVDDRVAGRDVGDRIPDAVVAKIDELRASESPLGAGFAEWAEEMLAAFIERRTMRPLSERTQMTMRGAGIELEGLNDILESALAAQAQDDGRLLRSSLAELARKQITASSQEAAEYRGDLLAGRGGDELLTALEICVRRQRFDVLFELIEWCRRDLSELGAPSERLGLKAFAALGAEGREADTLGAPAALAVKGGSALRAASAGIEVVAGADELREALAGRHAAWWTMMRFEGYVYWALLTEGWVGGGRIEVTESLEAALAAHRMAMPVVLESDREVVGADASEWCLRTAAMARAAMAGMIADVDLFEACIRALPADVATRVLERGSPGAGELMNAYRALGHALVPEPLERYLDGARERARLIVSVQPELASVPIGLLGTRDGRTLLERAPIGFAPPARATTMVASREEVGGPCAATLSIVNPTDDFALAPARAQGSELCGWGGAHELEEVATVEACSGALRDMAGSAPPARMSFLGHIRPGLAADPGSAALVLSPGEPGGSPAYLSAVELMRADLPVPDRVYLGGCEGAGFDTGLEWASVSAAMLVQGASCVLAHGWPVVEGEMAARVDRACVEAIDSTADAAGALHGLQREWLRAWRKGEPGAVPPHHWAGLHAIGRSRPEPAPRYA